MIYQNKIRFLGYVVSAKGIQIEKKQIKTVKNLLEPKLVRDIQVFIGFINFYHQFIYRFKKITVFRKILFYLKKAPISKKHFCTQKAHMYPKNLRK